jgi:hypothetical protein
MPVQEEGQIESDSLLNQRDFIFDSVNAQFHVRVFVEQMLANSIIPLALFFTNLRGQGFASKSLRALFSIYFPHLSSIR